MRQNRDDNAFTRAFLWGLLIGYLLVVGTVIGGWLLVRWLSP